MSTSMATPLELTVGAERVLGEVNFTAVDLFMFSAVGWHPHRIHYDLPYAESEGHPALVVHGPLQAVHLFQALAVALPHGSRITGTTYRHRRPLYLGTAATMYAAVAAVQDATASVEVWFADGDGIITTSGTATVELGA